MLSLVFTTQTLPSAPTPTSTAAPGIAFQLGLQSTTSSGTGST